MAGTTHHSGTHQRQRQEASGIAGATGKFAVCVVLPLPLASQHRSIPPIHSMPCLLSFDSGTRQQPTSPPTILQQSPMSSRYQDHDGETRRDRSVPGPQSFLMEIPCRCPSRDTLSLPAPGPGPPGQPGQQASSSDMVPVHLARRQSSRRPPRANVAFSSSARLPDDHSLASGSREENPGSLAPWRCPGPGLT